jgi:hypothetical protein
VIPGTNEVVPSLTAGTPDQTISVNLNGLLGSGLVLSIPTGIHEVDPLPASDPTIGGGCQIQ